MLRQLWMALQGKSQSEMKGYEMYFESCNFRYLGNNGFELFNVDLSVYTHGDHTPSFNFYLCICNFVLFDMNYVNAYHTVDDE